MPTCLMFAVAWLAAAHAADPPAVLAIRTHAQAVEKAIAAGEVVILEVNYNATDSPYPAVGPYGETLRFVRLWHESEDEGTELADRPVKIADTAQRAAMSWRSEYLYGDDGALRFAFLDDPTRGELRFYFDHGRNIRVIAGGEVHDDTTAFAADAGAVSARAADLMAFSGLLQKQHGHWEIFEAP